MRQHTATYEHERDRATALARVVAIVNDKGGVGKTSLAANLGGQLAAAGYATLLVDLNRQANLADDLGVRDSPIDDQGAALMMGLMQGKSPVVAQEVRPSLDLLPGGIQLEDLTPVMISRVQTRGRDAFLALGEVLAPLAHYYDLVVIDCPPENTVLTDLALGAARWVVMPTKSDAGGLVGMSLVAHRFQLAREINPSLGLLGAVLFATGTTARAIHAEARRAIEAAFGGASPLFSSTIRHAERTAVDARRLGKLAHELELEAANQPKWWEALRSGEKVARISETAASVAADYRNLAVEVLTAVRSAEEAQAQQKEAAS